MPTALHGWWSGSRSLASRSATTWAVTSLAADEPGFQPTRYWRGPIWPILNWVLQRGLDRYGYGDLRRTRFAGR